MISAANMAGGSWAGFQPSSVKTGEEEMCLANPDGILHRKILFDQGSLILNPFYRGMRETFEHSLRNPVVLGLLIKIDFFNLKMNHNL
jgi:hypothetical protein